MPGGNASVTHSHFAYKKLALHSVVTDVGEKLTQQNRTEENGGKEKMKDNRITKLADTVKDIEEQTQDTSHKLSFSSCKLTLPFVCLSRHDYLMGIFTA